MLALLALGRFKLPPWLVVIATAALASVVPVVLG